MNKKALLLFLPTYLFIINLSAQNPTVWRGNGTGVYHETGLLNEWPTDGPEILWSFEELGDGHSSPVIANNTIYVSGMVEETGYVYALSQDGKLKWKAPYGKEFSESYPGARTSVVVDGDLLYMYSGLGELVCMNAANGEKKWSKNVLKELGGENITWGVTETVVIDGDLLYVTPGGKTNNVVALNRFNGNLVWSSPGKGEPSAYCTPLLIELPARKLLVTHTADHIIGLDAKTGDLLWDYPQTNRWKVHANTPVYYNGGLFCFSGYGQGGVKLILSADGSSVSKAWAKTELDSRMGGIVLLDGYLYGSGDNAREWRCVNWETGEETYAAKDIAKGVVIAADGKLYCYSERGELALVSVNPKEFKMISKTKVDLGSAQHWAHPVINDGRLLVRHGNALIAYKIK
ncbi:PQQ-binding-like beta-propeller repeat protein [Maribellus sp. CM-23]|uniref:PQQ-binding-like beta-propeller repeat protein n=1 Tax=Maribellus sp. CM-23 TaxID=2781026 RepID=UPI001F25F0C6|nr:PQQ-binding-like beta-propeller repeat protein [Maribellus sp. CM-23]MCE4563000.1 PQQ-binding-like beta-propeller repeat protein [Maribellus sp. CM-23]